MEIASSSNKSGTNLNFGHNKKMDSSMDPSIFISAAERQRQNENEGLYILSQIGTADGLEGSSSASASGNGEGGSTNNDAVSPEIDSIVQIHKRKMQRRQANRKSAQLSRARKKAHLEELKEENQKLQHVADILDSQAELIFSFDVNGEVTHIPERMLALIKYGSEDPSEEITQVNQILTTESIETLMESLKELSNTKSQSQSVTFVKEVHYHDATGFPVAGFMRCSRLLRRKRARSKMEDDDAASDTDGEDQTSNKTPKKSSRKNYDPQDDSELDEYVCVIRPASASTSSTTHCWNNLHLLSAASMVAHDSVTTRSPKERYERRGSDSPSEGSNSSDVPHSSLTTEQTKNSTSSEENKSEDNNTNSSAADHHSDQSSEANN